MPIMPTTPRLSSGIEDECDKLVLQIMELQEDEAKGWCRTSELVTAQARLAHLRDEFAAFIWAKNHQGFNGSFEEWMKLQSKERESRQLPPAQGHGGL